ncbi:unnamed protein product [Cylindrotheca closterium]|uniref:Helicase-associated domain-containing protein n=1 Tax=Cylindrotheca closterium TaxID=2856 RepID=A0AAD2GD49_9STRA|nr:unnamed protein product [Cylindrotheca closterium]
MYNWVIQNKYHYHRLQKGEKSSRLTNDRISKLTTLGFDFSETGREHKRWSERLQELKDSKDTHGHFNVPDNVEEHKTLKTWIQKNQVAYNKFQQGEKSSMTYGRLDQLKAIGFRFSASARRKKPSKSSIIVSWKCPNAEWYQRLQELKEFHEAQDHFHVPMDVERYKLLSNWMLHNQRHYQNLKKGIKSSRLSSERLVGLMEIGYKFNPSEKTRFDGNDMNIQTCLIAPWDHRIKELTDFYKENGHFNVPKNEEAYKSLNFWMKYNQQAYNKIRRGIRSSRLADERMAQLKSIGFKFNVPEQGDFNGNIKLGCPIALWNQRVQELKHFKEAHGHFKVPKNVEAYISH